MQRNTTAEKEKNKTMNECRERKKTRPGMNVEKHNCRKRKKQDQEWMQRKKKTRPGMNAEKHNCRKKKCLKKIELAWTGAATHVAAHVSHTDHHRKLGLGSKRRERTGSKSQTSKTALCIKVYKRNERKTEVLKEEKKLELELPSSYDLIFFFLTKEQSSQLQTKKNSTRTLLNKSQQKLAKKRIEILTKPMWLELLSSHVLYSVFLQKNWTPTTTRVSSFYKEKIGFKHAKKWRLLSSDFCNFCWILQVQLVSSIFYFFSFCLQRLLCIAFQNKMNMFLPIFAIFLGRAGQFTCLLLVLLA